MSTLTWRAVDAGGRDPRTGRAPRGRASPSPAAALAAVPVATWPLHVVDDDGRQLTPARALGGGGDRVEALLDALTGRGGLAPDLDVEALARATPAGAVGLPLAVMARPAAVEAAAEVDPAWLGEVDARRAAMRRAVVAAGRVAELEAALHVTMLVATERLDPVEEDDVGAHVASGACLWLLAGAVVSALAGADPDPFGGWARLVAAGWWPVGPSRRRLVVGGPRRSAAGGRGAASPAA